MESKKKLIVKILIILLCIAIAVLPIISSLF